MNRRRTLTIIALVVAVVLLIGFIVVGVPFIASTFATPIPGLPTSNPASSPVSLQARFTQTALAKQSGSANNTTATPPATP